MPSYKDLIKQFTEEGSKQNPDSPQNPQDVNFDVLYDENFNHRKIDVTAAGNEEDIRKRASQMEAERSVPLSYKASQIEAVADNQSFSPEFYDAGFFETFGRSMAKGLGDHVIKGTGDMLQLVTNLIGGDMSDDGTVVSRALQEWGTKIKDNNEVFIPDELKPENITWKAFFNPDAWSIHFAEYIPQIAQFIMGGEIASVATKGLAKAGGKMFLEKAIAKKGLQMLKSPITGEMVAEAGSGIGLIGKAFTSAGELTEAGAFWSGTIGAGVVNNFASGLLNASQFVNQYRGKGVYTDEQLQEMAVDIMQRNALWMPVEMASWGLTYAGGWKGVGNAFRATKPIMKPGEEIAKGMFSNFAKTTSKYIKPLALPSKIAFEGVEESLQETFEDWTQIKAEEMQTGYNKYTSYMDYYMSDDSRATRIISAMAGVGGGAFGNIRAAINQSADENFDILNETLMLQNQIDSGFDEGVEMQKTHRSNKLMRLAFNERNDIAGGFIQNSLDKNLISQEEADDLTDEYNGYVEAQSKGKTLGLNVNGLYKFMESKKIIHDTKRRIKDAQENFKIKNQAMLEEPGLSVDEKLILEKKQEEELKIYLTEQLKHIAFAETNIGNILQGKKAEISQVNSTVSDYFIKNEGRKFGEQEVIETQVQGLSDEDYNDSYVKTDEEIFAKNKKALEPKKITLKGRALDLFDKLKDSTFNKLFKKDSQPEQNIPAEKQKNVIVTPDEAFSKDKAFSDFVKKSNEDDFNNFAKLEDDMKQSYFSNYNKQNNMEPNKGSNVNSNPDNEKELLDRKDVLEKELESISDDNNPRIEEIDKELTEIETKLKPVETKNKTVEPKSVSANSNIEIDELESSEITDTLEAVDIATGRKKAKLSQLKSVAKFLNENPIEEIRKKNKPTEKENIAKIIYKKYKKEIDDLIDQQELTEQEKKIVERKSSTKEKLSDNKNNIDDVVFDKNKSTDDDLMESYEEKKTKEKKTKGMKQKSDTDDDVSIPTHDVLRTQLLYAEKNASNIDKTKLEIAQSNYYEYIKAKHQYGLRVGDKMYAISNRLKVLFPNQQINVSLVDNMIDAIGIDSVGYALGTTIYLTEDAWNNSETFMHELMGHVYYSAGSNEPIVKKITNIGIKRGLYKEIRENYPEYVLIKDADGNVNTLGNILIDAGSIDPNTASIRTLEAMLNELKKDGYVELPQEEQSFITEEVFARTIQSTGTKKFDNFFNAQDKIATKSFWNWFTKYMSNNLEKDKDKVNYDKIIMDSENGKYFSDDEIMDAFVKSFPEEFNKKQINYGSGERLSFLGMKMKKKVDEQKEKNTIRKEIDKQLTNAYKSGENVLSIPEKNENESIEDNQYSYEQRQSIYEESLQQKLLKATKILDNFVKSYNRISRKINFQKEENVEGILDGVVFKNEMSLLARNSDNSTDFIFILENSKLQEMQAFMEWMDYAFKPNTKYAILSQMQAIYSNLEDHSGMKTFLKENGEIVLETALSKNEMSQVDYIMGRLSDFRQGSIDVAKRNNQNPLETQVQIERQNYHSKKWKEFVAAINDLKNNTNVDESLRIILRALGDTSYINLGELAKNGQLVIGNKQMPIYAVIKNFVDKDMHLTKEGNYAGKISPVNFRPLIQAIVNTNRRYRFDSIVKNAEGNNTPVKAIGSTLTRELKEMKSFLGTNKSLNTFLKRYSGILAKKGIENQLLVDIYNFYKKNGTFPELIQDLGIEVQNKESGTLFKESSSNEQFLQGLNRFLISKNDTYLQQIQLFGDSPRAFMLSTTKYKNSDIDKHLKSVYQIYKEKGGENISFNKFKQSVYNIQSHVDFLNDNANQLFKYAPYKALFSNVNGKLTLNQKGIDELSNYVANSTINSMFLSDVLTPNVPFKKETKVGKNLSSPGFVFDKKHKIGTIFVADPNKDMDGQQFILEEDAQKWGLTAGNIMDLGNGFKFLNHSIERDNQHLKGVNQLKSYTIILNDDYVDQNPKYKGLYELMKKEKAKYEQWFKKTYPNKEITNVLNDGEEHHTVIATTEGSVKTNTIPSRLGSVDFYTNNGDGVKTSPFTLDALNQSTVDAEKYLNRLNYNNRGNFVGIKGSDLEVQNKMDKITKSVQTPIQLIDNILTSAGSLDMEIAEKIQSLFTSSMLEKFSEITNKLDKNDPEFLENFVLKNMNRDEMDQTQRFLIENIGIFGPRVNTIVNNQIANSLKKAGNKLLTNGTYAQPKSDSGYLSKDYHTSKTGPSKLANYGINSDGTTREMEAILPAHMETDGINKRMIIALDNTAGKMAIKNYRHAQSKKNNAKIDELEKQGYKDLIPLYYAAIDEAKKRHSKANDENINDYVFNAYDDNGKLVGYFVKGDTVVATRVPSHGPSSTIWLEVIDFDKSKGNQITVSTKYKDITGGDYDGDALFIQSKTNSNSKINTAIQMLQDLWLSPEYHKLITTKLDFVDETQKITDDVNAKFNRKNEIIIPGTPKSFMKNFDDYIIANRNIGSGFNLHKILGLLSAYDTEYKTGVSINGKSFKILTNKQDNGLHGDGIESRNMKSAILANIILDNKTWQQANDLGINDNTIVVVSQLTNLGVPLKDISFIMNHPIVKKMSDKLDNGKSELLENVNPFTITDTLKVGNKKAGLTIISDPTNKEFYSDANANAILEMFKYLGNANSQLQKAIKILSGHNKIENNPLLLEQQISDYLSFMNNSLEGQEFIIKENVKNNPNNRKFLTVAQKTLDTLKKSSFYYHPKTIKLLENIKDSISYNGLTDKRIYSLTKNIETFMNSRLLGMNNISKSMYDQVLDKNPLSEESVYNELRDHIKDIKKEKNGYGKFKSNLLLSKALIYNFYGDNKYISINPSFFNDSLSDKEYNQVQEEFNQLPDRLQKRLLVYDIIKNGFSSPYSLTPIFGFYNEAMEFKRKNQYIDKSSGKYDEISNSVIDRLQKILTDYALLNERSGVPELELTKEQYSKNKLETVLNKIETKPTLIKKIKDKKAFYVKVKSGNESSIVKIESMTDEDFEVLSYMNRGRFKEDHRRKLLLEKVQEYKPENINNDNLNIHIASIKDKSIEDPFLNSYSNLFKKKSSSPISGMKQKAYINYSDAKVLSQNEFNDAMEFNKNYSDTQKKAAYLLYQENKDKANKIALNYTPDKVSKMPTDKLFNDFQIYGNKEAFSYSIITTPIVTELANRMAQEQVKLTGMNEDGSDIKAITAWMQSNNIPSNHPATQALVRELTLKYRDFQNEKRNYTERISKATKELYKSKFGFDPTSNSIKNTFKKITNFFFSNRKNLYQHLYGNLVEYFEYTDDFTNEVKKDFKMKSLGQLDYEHTKNLISDAEFEFAKIFHETTDSLKKYSIGDKQGREGYIPHVAMGTFETLYNQGLLGVLINSKTEDERLGDVKLFFAEDGEMVLMPFSDIKNHFMSQSGNFENTKDFITLKYKAMKLLKKGQNEDGTQIEYSDVEIKSAIGQSGLMNRFSNQRSNKAIMIPSMDLHKALTQYVHSTLFVNGNDKFEGFKKLLPLVDGVLSYNQKRSFDNINKYVKTVWKDYFFTGKKQETFGKLGDQVLKKSVFANLLWILGWKGLVIGKGLYAINNVVNGKYMHIKNTGNWIKGEKRYWGLDQSILNPFDIINRNKRVNNILKNMNMLDINIYDDVQITESGELDNFVSNLALMPMTWSEHWIQNVQALSILTDEEFDSFDENGNYRKGSIPISNQRILEIEEEIRRSQGKGYQPTDQRMIQMYSFGEAIMQFNRFIPTMFWDRFAKEDIDIYGKRHIGTLRAVGNGIREAVGKMNPKEFINYRNSLPPELRKSFDSGLKGIGISTLALIVGSQMNSDVANELYKDSNYYNNANHLLYKSIPSLARTVTGIK